MADIRVEMFENKGYHTVCRWCMSDVLAKYNYCAMTKEELEPYLQGKSPLQYAQKMALAKIGDEVVRIYLGKKECFILCKQHAKELTTGLKTLLGL